MYRTSVVARSFLIGAVALSALPGCSAKTADARQQLESEGMARATAGLPHGKHAKAVSGKPKLDPPLPVMDKAHFVAFDLLVNRPLAHRIAHADVAPTLTVDANAPDFVRYIHGDHTGDWMLGAKLDGKKGAGIKGRKATMWVPAYRPGAAQKLTVRVFNPAKWDNTLTVTVNGTALEPVKLADGWQTISLDVPKDSNLRGDNAVNFSFSNLGRIHGHLAGGAIAWLTLGRPLPTQPSAAKAAPAKKDAQKGAKSGGAGEKGAPKAASGAKPGANSATKVAMPAPSELPLGQDDLTLDAHDGLAWYVWVPKGAQLDLKMHAKEGCGVSAGLFVEDKQTGVAQATLATRNLVLGRGEEQHTDIDLSKWAGQVARLELRASDACKDKSVTLERAALVVPGKKPHVPDDVPPPKHVIFWMIDTLRADHVPLDFDTDVRAPNLVKLAKEGAHFKLAYDQGNESRTSHAALFTGEYPNRNGLVGHGILHPNQYLLPEALQDAGYFTGCHVANGYISRKGGFDQGWDFYVNNLREGWAIDGEGLAKEGVAWAKKHAKKKFFLYIGTIDPHVTYHAHKGITELYEKTPYHGEFEHYVSGETMGHIAAGRHVSDRDKVRIENLYKSEITYNDKAFGELRKGLEKAGIWKDTMVIVTADHGDEFWEHGGVGHGHGVHGEMVHVPLIMYYPPLIPKNTTVTAGVDVIDIYPTILDAVGAKRPKDTLQGKSLIPLMYDVNGGYPEPSTATNYLIHYGMQMQQWKLYLKRGDYSLYNDKKDPDEQTDVAAKHPLASRWLLDAMGYFRAHRKHWDKSKWGVSDKVKPGFLKAIEKDGP